MAILTCAALVGAWLALLCVLACAARVCFGGDPFRKVLWGVGLVFSLAILYYPVTLFAGGIAPRTVAVLMDPTYSMVDSTAAMPPQAIEDAKAIVESKILPGKLTWGDRELAYAVAPDFARAYRPISIERSSGSPRVVVGTKPSSRDRFSDYLGPITNLGRLLQSQRGTKLLFVVGDLLHQVPAGPNPTSDEPPLPTQGEQDLFRGVTVVAIYPDARARPYQESILPFWRSYFAARGVADWANQPQMREQAFAQALAGDALVPERPLGAAAVTAVVLLILTALIAPLCLRRSPGPAFHPKAAGPPPVGD